MALQGNIFIEEDENELAGALDPVPAGTWSRERPWRWQKSCTIENTGPTRDRDTKSGTTTAWRCV